MDWCPTPAGCSSFSMATPSMVMPMYDRLVAWTTVCTYPCSISDDLKKNGKQKNAVVTSNWNKGEEAAVVAAFR